LFNTLEKGTAGILGGELEASLNPIKLINSTELGIFSPLLAIRSNIYLANIYYL